MRTEIIPADDAYGAGAISVNNNGFVWIEGTPSTAVSPDRAAIMLTPRQAEQLRAALEPTP